MKNRRFSRLSKKLKRRPKITTLVVYGGSFDPLHLGHIGAIKLALRVLNPSLFLVVPAFRNPFKSQIHNSSKDRIKWLRRAVHCCIKSHRCKLSLFEIARNAPTPTIFTIRHLCKVYKASKIYFLLGADNLEELESWDAFEELSKKVEFVVLERSGYSFPHSYLSLPLEIPASSTQIRAGKEREFLPPFLRGLR